MKLLPVPKRQVQIEDQVLLCLTEDAAFQVGPKVVGPPEAAALTTP